MGHFTDSCFMPIKPIVTSPEPLKSCDSPRSSMSIRAVIRVGNILSADREPWLEEPWELNSCCTRKVYCKCTVSIVLKQYIFKVFMFEWQVNLFNYLGNMYRVLVGKPEGKRPLGRPRRRWVDNIRMDLWEVGIWTGLGWPRIEAGGGRLWVR